MNKSFYNTNRSSSEELAKSNEKAKTQEDQILKIFQSHKVLTASEAWKIYDSIGFTPLTSIRRAITNLCYAERIIKTSTTKIGIYGKKEHLYQLNTND